MNKRLGSASALFLIATFVCELNFSSIPAANAAMFSNGQNKPCTLQSGIQVPEINNMYQQFEGFTQPAPVQGGFLISYNPNMIAQFSAAIRMYVNQSLLHGVSGFTTNDLITAPLFQEELVAYHECTHARTGAGFTMEISVNCTGVLSMLNLGVATPHDIQVQSFLFNSTPLGMAPQPLQYGGSLRNFWDLTMACVDAALNHSPPGPGVAAPLPLDPVRPT